MSRYSLKKLLSIGTIEELARGVYRVPSGADLTEEEQFQVATLQVGQPSAICLISALAHYELIDTIPRKIWMMVPADKRVRAPDLKLFRSRNPKWKTGIETYPGYSITTIERSIVDALAYKSRVGTQIGLEALRKAVAQRKASLGKVLDLATKLEVDHRIRPYIEALSS